MVNLYCCVGILQANLARRPTRIKDGKSSSRVNYLSAKRRPCLFLLSWLFHIATATDSWTPWASGQQADNLCVFDESALVELSFNSY